VNWAEPWWELEEHADRLEEKLAALGTRTPRCIWDGCDETCPFMLTGVYPDIRCYEHELLRLGRPWLEDHHPAGQNNDPRTVPMPGNEHRLFSELQYRWPRDTLRNPDGSPLLQAAAPVRAWEDVLYVVMVLVAWVPLYLEQLDVWLRQKIGPRWWEYMDDPDA
jgi:hypothetical protein